MRPRKGDPQFGPVCACGSPKAKQAWTCQPCHGRIRGYNRVVNLGDEAINRARLAAALAVAHTEAEGELAWLVKEQVADDRSWYAQDRWAISLDAKTGGGLSLYETVAA